MLTRRSERFLADDFNNRDVRWVQLSNARLGEELGGEVSTGWMLFGFYVTVHVVVDTLADSGVEWLSSASRHAC